MTKSTPASRGAPMRVFLETGSRRTFACSVDWPGWCRSGTGTEAALAALADYAPRYLAVLDRVGLGGPARPESFVIVEETETGPSADFGSLHAIPRIDLTEGPGLDRAEIGRLAGIVRAAWSYLDAVVAGAPQALRKGPRGGGRDRDAIAEHVVAAELAYARRLGLPKIRASWGDRASVVAARDEVAAAIGAGDGPEGRRGEGRWPARTGARRVAWHALDHAWEIEDKST